MGRSENTTRIWICFSLAIMPLQLKMIVRVVEALFWGKSWGNLTWALQLWQFKGDTIISCKATQLIRVPKRKNACKDGRDLWLNSITMNMNTLIFHWILIKKVATLIWSLQKVLLEEGQWYLRRKICTKHKTDQKRIRLAFYLILMPQFSVQTFWPSLNTLSKIQNQSFHKIKICTKHCKSLIKSCIWCLSKQCF